MNINDYIVNKNENLSSVLKKIDKNEHGTIFIEDNLVFCCISVFILLLFLLFVFVVAYFCFCFCFALSFLIFYCILFFCVV